MRRGWRRLAGCALAVGLAACSSGRQRAAVELHRLAEAMEAHAGRYTSYPATLDPGAPASAANLPFAPRGGVEVRLVHADRAGFAATAFSPPWLCSLQFARGRGEQVDCAPLSSSMRDAGHPPPPPLERGTPAPSPALDSAHSGG